MSGGAVWRGGVRLVARVCGGWPLAAAASRPTRLPRLSLFTRVQVTCVAQRRDVTRTVAETKGDSDYMHWMRGEGEEEGKGEGE